MSILNTLQHTKNKGFTLIELLVVIAIIGSLSSVVLSQTNESRQKARTIKAVTDLKEIQKALEVYYSNHGYYPETTTSYDEWGGYWDQSSVDSFIPELEAENLIKPIPVGDGDIFYNYSRVETSGNPGYCLMENRDKYDYVLVAYNLYPIPGLTTGDACEDPSVWDSGCGSETTENTYCIIKHK